MFVGVITLSAVTQNQVAQAAKHLPCHQKPSAPMNSQVIEGLKRNLEKEFEIAGNDGTWSGGGGGGTGIACFKKEADAEKARAARKADLPLPRSLIPKITSLKTTEIAENDQVQFAPPQPGENSSTYLERILHAHLDTAVPSFHEKLNTALALVQLERGQAANQSGKLKPIQDTGEILDLDSGKGLCVPVQIVVRRARRGNDGGIQTILGVDYDLYDKLGMKDSKISNEDRIIHQAALKLHEAVYLITYALQHGNNSELSRTLTATLLSNNLFDNLNKGAPKNPEVTNLSGFQMLHTLFSTGLGNFPYSDGQKIPDNRLMLMAGYAEAEDIYKRASIMAAIFNIPPQNRTAFITEKIAEGYTKSSEHGAFMTAAEFAVAHSKLRDFYALIDPQHENSNEIKTVCQFARDYIQMLDQGVAPAADRDAEKTMFTRALKYCSRISDP